MEPSDLEQLERFIVRAKASSYGGEDNRLLPYRLDSHDVQYFEGDWAYHDSYVGESDFSGQEVAYLRRKAVWAMNYYGRIVEPSAITGAEAGRVIRSSLSALYHEGRFLGGYRHVSDPFTYYDTNDGDFTWFHGREWISTEQGLVYELLYHGGLIR